MRPKAEYFSPLEENAERLAKVAERFGDLPLALFDMRRVWFGCCFDVKRLARSSKPVPLFAFFGRRGATVAEAARSAKEQRERGGEIEDFRRTEPGFIGALEGDWPVRRIPFFELDAMLAEDFLEEVRARLAELGVAELLTREGIERLAPAEL